MAKYPEHEKLQTLNGVNQIVGDFIEWLGERDLIIAEYANDTELMPARKSRDRLLAEFFDIDTNKLESEKRQMLDEIRAASETNETSNAYVEDNGQFGVGA